MMGDSNEGNVSLFRGREERRAKQEEVRKRGRKFIKGKDVKPEWNQKHGVWLSGLVSQDQGFDNRIIEVDVHVVPPNSHTATHKHNEAILHILSGSGYSVVNGERIDWEKGDTLYVAAGDWHQHFNPNPEPAVQLAIKPIPLQEYIGELNITPKGDKPLINDEFVPDPIW